MSHEITTLANGQSEAIYSGNGTVAVPAWHGLGINAIEDGLTWEKIVIDNNILNWSVGVYPAAAKIEGVYVDSTVEDDFCFTVREDNNRILGQVKSGYRPIQNLDAFSFLNGMMENNEIKYESAFSLRGGKVVCLLARMPEVDEIAPGDTTKRYLLFVNHHDGAGACKVFPTSVRVQCANMLRVALSKDGRDGITIRHVGDIGRKIDAAKKVLAATSEVFASALSIERKMAATKIDDVRFGQFIEAVYPTPRDIDGKPLEGKGLTQRNNVVGDVSSLYYRGPLNQGPIARTVYAALNAVTEHVNHSSRVRKTVTNPSNEARFNKIMFGSGTGIMEIAYQTATAMVE